ncbi:RNA-binding protein 2-like [Phragmites australis]|uniref:RNA-binding protein 2-like n=1 Tax=Phragmites australis TaxID=29695 RepID=UPI002D796A2D|nr:RNA-binding protein 2-like [Phragmites australis]
MALTLLPSPTTESGDKAYVLCFVEFKNAKCAFTAMEAFQEYCFDDRKPDAPVLKIQFARFPFRLPAAPDDRKRLIAHSLLFPIIL